MGRTSMKWIALVTLAASLGVTAASASVPDLPSRVTHKAPAKGPLKARARHAPAPAKSKADTLSSAARAHVSELMDRGGRAFNNRDWAGAIAAYNEAIALDPTNASAHFNLAAANYWGVVD